MLPTRPCLPPCPLFAFVLQKTQTDLPNAETLRADGFGHPGRSASIPQLIPAPAASASGPAGWRACCPLTSRADGASPANPANGWPDSAGLCAAGSVPPAAPAGGERGCADAGRKGAYCGHSSRPGLLARVPWASPATCCRRPRLARDMGHGPPGCPVDAGCRAPRRQMPLPCGWRRTRAAKARGLGRGRGIGGVCAARPPFPAPQ